MKLGNCRCHVVPSAHTDLLYVVPAFRPAGLLAPRGGSRSVCYDAFVPNTVPEMRFIAGTVNVERAVTSD
jgi:hypothetical protein